MNKFNVTHCCSDKLIIDEDYCENDSLEDIILELSQIPSVIREIVNGLDELHSNGIVHGNLKPSNIFINKKTNEILLSGCLMNNYRNVEDLTFNHLRYMSPEQILKKNIGKESDLFNLGLIIYKIYSNEDLLVGSNIHHLWKEFGRIKMKLSMSKLPFEVKELLKVLLMINKDERINMKKLKMICNSNLTINEISIDNLSIYELKMKYNCCSSYEEKYLLFMDLSKFIDKIIVKVELLNKKEYEVIEYFILEFVFVLCIEDVSNKLLCFRIKHVKDNKSFINLIRCINGKESIFLNDEKKKIGIKEEKILKNKYESNKNVLLLLKEGMRLLNDIKSIRDNNTHSNNFNTSNTTNTNTTINNNNNNNSLNITNFTDLYNFVNFNENFNDDISYNDNTDLHDANSVVYYRDDDEISSDTTNMTINWFVNDLLDVKNSMMNDTRFSIY